MWDEGSGGTAHTEDEGFGGTASTHDGALTVLPVTEVKVFRFTACTEDDWCGGTDLSGDQGLQHTLISAYCPGQK